MIQKAKMPKVIEELIKTLRLRYKAPEAPLDILWENGYSHGYLDALEKIRKAKNES